MVSRPLRVTPVTLPSGIVWTGRVKPIERYLDINHYVMRAQIGWINRFCTLVWNFTSQLKN